MRWEGNRESSNVEDARSGGGGGFGGIGGRSIGIGTIVVALVGGALLGVNPLTILSILTGGGAPVVQQQGPAQAPPADDKMAKFVSTVLGDTEDVWKQLFTQGGATYREPKLVLFRGAVGTQCGTGQSAMGPFYCPADQKVYIDLNFYETLKTRMGAPGDFAQAYVIAHEVGHHVQHLLGITEQVERQRARGGAQANAMSVRLELQADCFAGVWAHHAQNARQILEQGDVEEAMNAAAKIGDDALQKSSGRGVVVPESFTHGSSEQRQRWFNTGLKTGSVKACDTFSARSL